MNFRGTIDWVVYHDGIATIQIVGEHCPDKLIVENPPINFALMGASGLEISGNGSVICVEGYPVADRRGNGAVRWRKKRNAAERQG